MILRPLRARLGARRARARLLGLVLSAIGCSSADAEADKAKPRPSCREARHRRSTTSRATSTRRTPSKVDVNGDGKPDIIHVMKGGKEVCRDRRPEHGRRSSTSSSTTTTRAASAAASRDFDRDGRADEIADLRERRSSSSSCARPTSTTSIDTWDYYENGRLVRRERDSDGDGIIDQWWTFNNPANPKCAIVAIGPQRATASPIPTASSISAASRTARPPAPAEPAGPAAPPPHGAARPRRRRRRRPRPPPRPSAPPACARRTPAAPRQPQPKK